MVTTKKISKNYAGKNMRRITKWFNKKNQLNTTKGSNEGNEGQKVHMRHIQKTNSQIAEISPSLFVITLNKN